MGLTRAPASPRSPAVHELAGAQPGQPARDRRTQARADCCGPALRHRRVSSEPDQRHQIRFQPAARRAIAERLPGTVAVAVLEFCEAALAVNPHRVSKPLLGPIAGCHGARRGTYRIVYWIEENTRTVHCLDIDHRAEIYLHGPCTGR
jgi:mRNA interferase RelE/StbE